MNKILWTEAMSSGISSMDMQHKELLRILNSIQQSISTGEDAKAFTDALSRLKGYATYHFAYEERLMHNHGFPRREEHVKLHRYFVDKVATFQKDAPENVGERLPEIQDFLLHWLVEHIQNMDKELGAHLAAQGVEQNL